MNAKDDIRLSIIVARARGGVIGYQGEMPWRIPSELTHFKHTTLGKPILMGRKTWESLRLRPLPGRDNLVLTRDKDFHAPGAECFTDFETMCARGRSLVKERGVAEMVVIGGAMLYALALPCADRVYLTEIEADVAGDVWFEDLSLSKWRLSGTISGTPKSSDEYSYFIKTFNAV